VKVPPVISEDVQPTKRVVAGETAELSCEASGVNVLKNLPKSGLTWTRGQ
jgi:hypothetical protein